MTRLLLVLLAALTAVIGYLTAFSWLYIGAVAFLLGALGLAVRDLLREHDFLRKYDFLREHHVEQHEAPPGAEAPRAGEEELRSLGIMEIRPQQQTASDETDPAAEAPPPEEAEAPHQKARPHDDVSSKRKAEKAPETAGEAGPEEPGRDHRSTNKTSPPEKDDVLHALVHAVRLAVGARTACLLAQEELALSYRIEALDSAADAPPARTPGTSFSTDAALLSASAARQPVTRVPVGSGDQGLSTSHLGYYQHPDALGPERTPAAVALVPVPLPDSPTMHFLLLDDPRAASEGQDTLLERFAALFAQVVAPAEDVSLPSAGPASSDSASSPSAPSLDETRVNAAQTPPAENGRAMSSDGDPRPRREIIAEEMERARAGGHPLALALVYLNRAEAVAERGGAQEVEAAERALRARLRQAIPSDGRVERFGELTYGVFLPHKRADAEQWAVAFEEELAEASDPLEGGVSLGLTVMRDSDQSPEALRENATHALREAVTTGTCTVLE